jgi:hypothetical protein
VKKIKPDGSKTIYVGGIYEVDKTSGGSVTRTVTYYPVAGAMRINSTLYYILKDHLGSASVVTDASGSLRLRSGQALWASSAIMKHPCGAIPTAASHHATPSTAIKCAAAASITKMCQVSWKPKTPGLKLKILVMYTMAPSV